MKILVTCPMDHLPEACAILEFAAEVTYVEKLSDKELFEKIPPYDAVVTNLQQRFDKKFVDAGKNLKVIATPSTGTDHIDCEYAQSKGIVIQSIKSDYEVLKTITSTAEHAFLLMMACLRKLPFAFDTVRKGQWKRNEFRGRELSGRIVGIVGYGRLGEMFSRFARVFDMKVIAHDPNKTINDLWVHQVKFDELLKQAKIITIHVHLTPETRNLFGKREFSLMRDGVYLINTSRGAIIDEVAFLDALKSGKIACAGIDVLAHELDGDIESDPLVQHARANCNLIITPHIGGYSYDAQEKAYRHMARKLISFFQNMEK